RKQFRIIARRGKFTRGELDNLLVPGVDDRPPLALVYPDYVLLKRAAGQRSLIAICGCGVFGAPEQLAWMGSCCGPCHDQREERGHPAKPWPDPGKTTVFGTVPATALSFRPILACSPDGRTLAVNKAA